MSQMSSGKHVNIRGSILNELSIRWEIERIENPTTTSDKLGGYINDLLQDIINKSKPITMDQLDNMERNIKLLRQVIEKRQGDITET